MSHLDKENVSQGYKAYNSSPKGKGRKTFVQYQEAYGHLFSTPAERIALNVVADEKAPGEPTMADLFGIISAMQERIDALTTPEGIVPTPAPKRGPRSPEEGR